MPENGDTGSIKIPRSWVKLVLQILATLAAAGALTTGGVKVKGSVDESRKQDEKFWRLHNWAREQINIMRFEDGKPPVQWPDLGSD